MSQSTELPQELVGLDDFAGREPDDTSREKYVFRNTIPKLGPSVEGESVPALLDKGGITGVLYAQIPVQHLKAYQDWGWHQVIGKDGKVLPVFAIEGPSGRLDCVLLAKGQEIRGTASDSNKRLCRIHKDIRIITGLGAAAAEAEPAKPEKGKGKK